MTDPTSDSHIDSDTRDEIKHLNNIVQGEIDTAKKQHKTLASLSSGLMAAVIFFGSLATFFAATGQVFFEVDGAEGSKFVTAGLAFLTTLAGTLEKSFGLEKKASGHREAKVKFQNLQLSLAEARSSREVTMVSDGIKETRLLKNELTK